ncbi:MAG: T9SS C-terminal target domain-containing protein [Ignavibacteriae bacterium]|nr:MAG: T9SS C-terminal target domain-containing protein [Ignavibacteriota bacterium]
MINFIEVFSNKTNLSCCKIISLLIMLSISYTSQLYSQDDWVVRYTGATNSSNDAAKSMIVDQYNGDVYILGSGDSDFVTIKYNKAGVQQWVAVYDGSGNDVPQDLVTDIYGNIYVTGGSDGAGGTFDFLTIKYNNSGQQQWVARHQSNRPANAVTVDSDGFVFITGTNLNVNNSIALVTIKYNSSGQQVWIRNFHHTTSFPNDGKMIAIALDYASNVHISGYYTYLNDGNFNFDFLTIKYDTSGTQLWIEKYNGPTNGNDILYDMALDPSVNVYITGSSNGVGNGSNYTTIKYNSTGVLQWVATYNGPASGDDVPNAMILEANQYIYVTGYSAGNGTQNDFATVKYNPSGQEQWVARYNGPGYFNLKEDKATALTIDLFGSLFVTGYSQGYTASDNADYATIKYNSSGQQQWVGRYNGSGNLGDIPCAIGFDEYGAIYVTGSSIGNGTNSDILTIKYTTPPVTTPDLVSPSNGAEVLPGSLLLDWSDVTNASSYQVQVSVDSSFATTVVNQTVSSSDYTVPNGTFTNSTQYFWRANAVDVYGPGFWSVLWSFTPVSPCSLTVNAGSDTTIWNLSGDHATLTATAAGGTAPVHYSWSTGDTTQTINVSPADTTKYIVNVTDGAGCSAYDTVQVNVFHIACDNNKVLICHKGRTLCINLSQIQQHLNHGDKLGPCNTGAQPFALYENYPNPFNPVTAIKFSVPVASHVKVAIYDITGREVAKLVDEKLDAGIHSYNWDASNFASGVYFYTFSAGSFYETRKMVLIK